MGLILFTAAGCARCQIAKIFMRKKHLSFDEHDAIGEGKELFGRFYRAHRAALVRGAAGVEFPVMNDDGEVRQGVAAVAAWLQAGARLDGFIGRSEPSKGWVGGLHVSQGDPAAVEDLIDVLGFLKKSGLKLELDTDGRNAAVLARLLELGLGDRVVMDLKGPRALYEVLTGAPVDAEEVSRSMALVARFPEYRFETAVALTPRPAEDPAALHCLTPAEVAETAQWLKAATGSHRQPYVLLARAQPDDPARPVQSLSPGSLVRHRTAARRHQVLTEIKTTSQ
jgi:pyruvate formate lyase activating enzyme